MSAAEIIAQIKALSAAERAEVVRFVRSFEEADTSPVGSGLSREDRFRQAANRVFAKHDEVLRRLAE